MEDFCNSWLKIKKDALKKGDYGFYKRVLREIQKELSKWYVELEMPEAISLVERMLKVTTCELKEINIKYKRGEIPF